MSVYVGQPQEFTQAEINVLEMILTATHTSPTLPDLVKEARKYDLISRGLVTEDLSDPDYPQLSLPSETQIILALQRDLRKPS